MQEGTWRDGLATDRVAVAMVERRKAAAAAAAGGERSKLKQ